MGNLSNTPPETLKEAHNLRDEALATVPPEVLAYAQAKLNWMPVRMAYGETPPLAPERNQTRLQACRTAWRLLNLVETPASSVIGQLHATVRGFLAAIPHGLPYAAEVQAERVGAWVKALEDLPMYAIGEATNSLLRQIRDVPAPADVRAESGKFIDVQICEARKAISEWIDETKDPA